MTRLSKLETLKLRGTKVTDAGVEGLKNLKALKSLGVRFLEVSDDTLASLNKALPKLTIVK